ncbi:peroxisomal copper amine oxidase [Trametes versicolor FP-101664 SS1]|uniref:peroxisomal copper amine oxidase n=1 Tax=Trametes versicolor (strain FP-101664) TaxID=717944 RepID=UPI0004621822|nr:peroxisomal copper amine oxidase [Trametes versicolor FP-101664 SS1]EIW52569.1 peroxisomal copper amine oxidase [Trametes versicolor FP-101664 SS1]
MSVPLTAPSTATEVKTSEGPLKVPAFKHPLDPLTPEEIVAVSHSVRRYVAEKTEIKAVRFITSSLLPPPKKAVLAYLGIPLLSGEKPEPASEIVRKAEADFVDAVTGAAYNIVVSLHGQDWTVDSLDKLPEDVQPQISVEELLMCEEIIRADERVIKLAAEVGVTPDQLHADGWAIGFDERFPSNKRIQQALMFARWSRHENLYAHPLDFIPVVDSITKKVIYIDFPPSYKPKGETSLFESAGVSVDSTASTTAPPPLSEDSFKSANRKRVPPPKESHDFLPDLLAQKEGFKYRDDIKPLHVVQPEGVSFKMDGNVLEWQKWKMHVAFHHREGIALSTITYNDDGTVRPIFYRLSLSEMVVPYGAPEHPHPRKHAFDVGEYGMGTMANELTLGCDCLGQIHYLPGAYVAHDGSAVSVKNVICIHEEDAGLLWKHTDFRVGGRAQAVRSRRLVIQQICTLANYEYIFNYMFYQDGNIEVEIRLTGILQVYAQGEDEPNGPFGTTLAPGIHAHYHQHIFSMRVDPMVDGLQNSVVETDILPLPNAPTGSAANHVGNAFIARGTPIARAADGARDYDYGTDRRWAIVNPKKVHAASKRNAGYTIMGKGAAAPLMALEGSVVAKRAAFARKQLWVVRDVEGPKGGRMWPSGKYVPQTRESPEDSLPYWAKGDESLLEEDLLVYITMGITHIPRPEDWPVMPAEHLRLVFRPTNFFTANPSMDVPGANDSKSRPAFPDSTDATTGGACCE